MKKRIFLTNDASFLNTGYGIYGKEILSRLHNSDKYEVAELGCYASKNNPAIQNIPWKFYPNAVTADDPRFNQYKSNPLNQFGLWRFNRCIVDFKPHIVFDVRDYWMFSYQEVSPYKKYFSWAIMPATDSAPPKIEWLHTFSNADIVIPYTEWAKKTLSESCGNQINLFPKVANAGINPNEFYPIEDKINHKIKYFGKECNVIGTVMRNQKRKLFPDLMLAFKQYLSYLEQSNQKDLYDKTILYLHTSYPENAGWDIPALLIEYGIANKTYFTYHCRNCKQFFPAKFQQASTACHHCNSRSASVASPINGISTSQLNEVYNLFDIFVQYAICEGFGMPQVEAAACGIPIASVDYSAMTEIAENLDGYKIPLARIFREMETNADRVYPDINSTTQIFVDFFKLSDTNRKQKAQITREKCLSLYTWDNVYKVWEECFDNIDLSKKLDWHNPQFSQPKHTSLKVPQNLTDKEFIHYICYHVINDNDLISTAPIQTLLRDVASGISANGDIISSMTRQNIVEKLESFLNNKIMCEKMRIEPQSIVKEDFI